MKTLALSVAALICCAHGGSKFAPGKAGSGAVLDRSLIRTVGLEITTLEVRPFMEGAGAKEIDHATITYRVKLDSLFKRGFVEKLGIVHRLANDEIDGCLDGIGHDVTFTLYMEDGTQSEIFFGCGEYDAGTLRIGNDYGRFWKVAFPKPFQDEMEKVISGKKLAIGAYQLARIEK